MNNEINIPIVNKIIEKEINTNLVLNFLNSDYPITENWIDLFTQSILLNQYNKMPSKLWYQETQILIEKLGTDDFLEVGFKWINDCVIKSKEENLYWNIKKAGTLIAGASMQTNLGLKDGKIPDWVRKVYGNKISDNGFFQMGDYAYLNDFQNYFYQSLGGRILRGFLHSTVILKDKRLIDLVDSIAHSVPNNSQDAIHVYSNLPKEIAIPKLTYLKSKATNKNILSRINKAITEVGNNVGLTKSEIEETVVPDFGINENNEFISIINNIKCIYQIQNLKNSSLKFILNDGKEQKTLPTQIKDEFSSEFKEFKQISNEIKQTLVSQRKRIEEFYLIDRKITYNIFKKNYLDNNLIKILSKDLIWNFQNNEINLNLIFHNERFVDSNGKINQYDLSNCIVSLWHSIGFESDYILSWRNFIIDNEIFQPFKQAFREIYILTDAELATNSYSNRYASHILKKDHVSALCKARGWSPSGIINDGKILYRIPGNELKAEFWVSDVNLGAYSNIYGSAHISTDQVRFYKKKEQLVLSDVPAMIFSEVMRDIDLFVGVTSIGNDPEWHDRGAENAQTYWSTYSNGELTASSKIRAEILKNIIPKMKISKFCDFEGKYLKVKGKIRNYKIHMGSGNILMEPDDKYLCIVPDRSIASVKNVFIPFEGDILLSIIISKAILLVDDDKTKDQTIINQINFK